MSINTTTQEYLNNKLGTQGLSKQQCLNRLAGAAASSGSTGLSAAEAAGRYASLGINSGQTVQGGLNRKVGIVNPAGLTTQIAASRL